MGPLILQLPDELADWRGTAGELADKANELLLSIPGLADDAGTANERLIRHYVQVGVLTAPEREGREAMFGLRQVVEFLAARFLLRDGWPLAKAAELLQATDVAGLTKLIPSEPSHTKAEQVVAKYRARPVSGSSRPSPASAPNFPSAKESSNSRSAQSAPEPAGENASPLALAAGISRRRVSLEENLKTLGNPAGRTDRRRIVRVEITPWCHVDVDVRRLAEFDEDAPTILGAALTQALLEERLQRGK